MNAPPLLVSFSGDVDLLCRALSKDAKEKYEGEIRALVLRGRPPAVSVTVLSTLFGVSIEFVRTLTLRPHRYYRKFTIRKGKKTRVIQAPRVALKTIQKWFGFHLAESITYRKSVFGFVPRKSVIDAAVVHCGARWVYSLDLRDFFPSITAEQVTMALKEIGYSAHAASLVVSLCTLDGCLPQGSPASPVLSNIVFAQTDDRLQKLADEHQVRFTRYADDIVFSGNNTPPPLLQEQVKTIVSQEGWQIAPEKEHLAQWPRRLKVHGLLVSGDKPRLTKGYRNRIRAYKHLLVKDQVRSEDRAKILGHIAYSHTVEKRQA